jgi:acyl-CoA dehydrogenase
MGARARGPSDAVVHACAQLVLEPSVARDRLTQGLSHVDDDNGVARLEKAFLLVTAVEDVFKRMRAARLHDTDAAIKQGVITQVEAEKYKVAQEAVLRVIEVDDFAPEALSPFKKSVNVQVLQERSEARAAG